MSVLLQYYTRKRITSTTQFNTKQLENFFLEVKNNPLEATTIDTETVTPIFNLIFLFLVQAALTHTFHTHTCKQNKKENQAGSTFFNFNFSYWNFTSIEFSKVK